MKTVDLIATGLTVGMTADTNVSFLVVKTEANMLVQSKIVTGTLHEVLKSIAEDFLPERDEDDLEEDGEYDLSTPESCLSEIYEQQDKCYDDDPALLIFDLQAQTIVYTYTG